MSSSRGVQMALVIPENIKYKSSKDFAYEVLLFNIIHWNLLPGQILKDSEISGELNISRTPVREALNSLREDHLIHVGSTTSVSLMDAKIIYEDVYLRTAMEPLIAARICGKLSEKQKGILWENLERQHLIIEGNIGKKSFYELDNEFHDLFYQFAGWEFTCSVVNKACLQLHRLRCWTFLTAEVDKPSIYQQHLSIFNAMVENRLPDLMKLTQLHCLSTHLDFHMPQVIKTLLEPHPEYFEIAQEMITLTEQAHSQMQLLDRMTTIPVKGN